MSNSKGSWNSETYLNNFVQDADEDVSGVE